MRTTIWASFAVIMVFAITLSGVVVILWDFDPRWLLPSLIGSLVASYGLSDSLLRSF